jgi:NADPH:quinone reductase-like Zn-dependent oxidoreductase
MLLMSTMKAVRMHEYGGPEVLRYEDTMRPGAGAGELLVRVAAAGVNPIDIKVRSGHMKQMVQLKLPWTPGVDFSGTVDAVGSNTSGFAVGDEVFGKTDLPRDGSYAQLVAVAAANVARKPRSIDHVRAAGIPLAALTAWQCLISEGSLELQRGQTLLVLGAAGGVGTFALQLARWKGARVLAVARANHEPYLRELGVERVVDPEKDLSAAGEVDAVLDLVGGEVAARAARQLKSGGAIASTVAPKPPAEARGARAIFVLTKSDGQQLAEIGNLVDQGVVKSVVARTFPLAHAAEAHAALDAGGMNGKLVLTP